MSSYKQIVIKRFLEQIALSYNWGPSGVPRQTSHRQYVLSYGAIKIICIIEMLYYNISYDSIHIRRTITGIVDHE